MTERLPGGGKPWFVRRKKVHRFGTAQWQLVPCSKEGWMVILAYFAVAFLAVLILFPEPTPMRMVIWGTVEVVATVLMLVVAFRMSPPVWREE